MKKIQLNNIEWRDRFGYQKAVLFNEEELNSPGSKVQVIKIEPGGVIKPHFHKIRTEVFLVLQGQGVIKMGDEDNECSVNDLLLCEQNTVHAFRNTGNEDFILAVFRTNDTGDSDMIFVDDMKE